MEQLDDGIGFDAAIDRAIDLLGIPENEVTSRAFVPGYPIGSSAAPFSVDSGEDPHMKTRAPSSANF